MRKGVPCALLNADANGLISSEPAIELPVCVQVAMRRTLLLASVCVNASRGQDHTHWTERYRTLIVGPRGENIAVKDGHMLANSMASILKAMCGKSLPLRVSKTMQCMTLAVLDSEAFEEARP